MATASLESFSSLLEVVMTVLESAVEDASASLKALVPATDVLEGGLVTAAGTITFAMNTLTGSVYEIYRTFVKADSELLFFARRTTIAHDALVDFTRAVRGGTAALAEATALPTPPPIINPTVANPAVPSILTGAVELPGEATHPPSRIPPPEPTRDVGGSASGFSRILGTLTTALSTFLGVIIGFAVVEKFVSALNPAVAEQFSLSLRDLMATLGVAAEPLIEVFTHFARVIAGVILPVMEALRPAATSLGELLGGLLTEAAALLGSVLLPLAPIAQIVTDALGALLPIIDGVVLTISFLGDILAAVLTPIAQGLAVIFRIVGNVFRTAILAITSVVVKLLEVASSIPVIGAAFEKMADALRKRALGLVAGQEGGAKAAIEPRISTLAGLTRDMALAAAKSGTKPHDDERTRLDRERNELLRGISDQLKRDPKTGRPVSTPDKPPRQPMLPDPGTLPFLT